MLLTSERLDDWVEPVSTTTGLVASADWSVLQFAARRIGKFVFVTMQVQNVSAVITTSGTADFQVVNGDIVGDPTVATLPDGWRPSDDVVCSWDNGIESGRARVEPGGSVRLLTITYRQSIPTSRNVRVSFSFIQTT